MPVPDPLAVSVNTPGCDATRFTGSGAESALPCCTTKGKVVPTGRSNGRIALTCVGETTYSGSNSPPIDTDVPPSCVGHGSDVAVYSCPVSVRLFPKIVISVPGASGVCRLKLAALRTPPAATAGGAAPAVPTVSLTVTARTGFEAVDEVT